jgi:hypothetical protein
MKTDYYTKTVLTIIAFCLVVLILQGGITKVHAGDATFKPNYALVPLNPDGSINVHIKSFDSEQEVVIVGWKEQYLNKVYDLGKNPFPVQNK